MDARLQEEIRAEAAKSGISETMAWHVVMTREIQAGRIVPLSAEGFDPNQPRDEDGKWSASGTATSGRWAVHSGKIHYEGKPLDDALFTYDIKQTGPEDGDIEKTLIEGRFAKQKLHGASSIHPADVRQKQDEDNAAWSKIAKQRIPIMRGRKVVTPPQHAAEIDDWLRKAGQGRMADYLKSGPRGD